MTNQLREVVADALPAVTLEQAFYMVSTRDLTAAEFAQKVRALATLPTQSAGVEERARELLAAEFMRDSVTHASARRLAADNETPVEQAALRAIAAALRTPASEGDGGRVVACCACGKPVDTRENDTPGSELTDGRWVCSGDCWDLATSPLATTPPNQQEARAVDDEMVERAARIVAELAGEDFDLIGGFAQGILLDTQRAALTAALQPGSPK